METLKEVQQAYEIEQLRRRIQELEAVLPFTARNMSAVETNAPEEVRIKDSGVRTLNRHVTVTSSFDDLRGGFRVNGVCGHPLGDFTLGYFCERVMSKDAILDQLVVQHRLFVHKVAEHLRGAK